MVGVRGFEPPAPASRRQCSTGLSYTPSAAKVHGTRAYNRMGVRGASAPKHACLAETEGLVRSINAEVDYV